MAEWNPTQYTKRNWSTIKPTTITKDWRSVPWAALHKNVEDELEVVLATAEQEFDDKFEQFLLAEEERIVALNPEGGAYEGNIRDQYTRGKLPGKYRLIRETTNDVVAAFLERHQFGTMAMAMLPEIIKFISTFKLTTVEGETYDGNNGKISGGAFIKQVFSDSTMQGLYDFLMFDTRSKYLDTQYKAPSKSYCALVPLILYAFKLHRNVPYSHWDREDIPGVVNQQLSDAMLYVPEVPFTKDDIMLSREIGLKVKTGTKAGQDRSPVFTFKLYGQHPLSIAPSYAQVMYSQIWCAHPSNRTKYMVLDPSNWDSIPPNLVPEAVLTTNTTTWNPIVEDKWS